MCELNKNITNKKVKGYKIVAKKISTGEYYSLAFGFKYTNKPIPICKKQKVIGGFHSEILEINFCPNMKGRTAIFTILNDALTLWNILFDNCYISKNPKVDPCKYQYCLVEAEISKDLMEGTYFVSPNNTEARVIAGRNLNIIQEFIFPPQSI